MQSRLLHEQPDTGLRTFGVVFEKGDPVVSLLEAFAREANLTGAQLTAIGAFSDAELAFYDWDRKDYREIPVREQVEVLVLAGDVAIEDGKPTVHAHAVLGRADGQTVGGHLVEAHVRPTLELILTELPAHLHKRRDPESGLALLDMLSE